MKTLLIDLSVDEINALLQILGEMPNKTGSYPLLMKIRDQAQAQLTEQPQEDV